MFKTVQLGSDRCNEHVWQPVEEDSRVENFPNGSEATEELKIRRYLVPWGFDSPFRHHRFLIVLRDLRVS
jgi:hypothetical protein